MERLSDYQKAQKWLEGYDWDNDPTSDDNLATICEALQEIEEYKDLEEQGKLLKLPCAVGSLVYKPYQFMGDGAWEIDVHKIELEDLDKIGKTVFLTKPAAEQALKEMERKK